ncbi:MAG: hypothetical protein R6V17_09045 [Halanaerobacter sp.]
MFNNQFPNFKRGSILKKELLNNLRDYPRAMINLYFSDYAEGVLAGSNLKIEGNEIVIKPGIIKFNEQIYLLTQEERILYQATNQEMMIKIKFLAKEESSDFKTWRSELTLANSLEVTENELELGRFKLREGAKLRTDYDQFSDFATEYNTVNIIHVKYASREKWTIHPLIMDFFAHKILNSDTENQFDISFAMQTLQTGIVKRELITSYLQRKLELTQKSFSNLEIYNYLARIIRSLSRYQFQTAEMERENKILID